MSEKQVIISGIHIELTEALKNIVQEKMDKIFKHEKSIVRIRVELIQDIHKKDDHEFGAKGHIEIHGPDIIVSAFSKNLYKAIDEMTIKMDRQIRRRSCSQKAKRNHCHGVDIPAAIPKS